MDNTTIMFKKDRDRNKAPQTIAKLELMSKKIMLCVWWNWKRIHYELLPPGKTIDSDLYYRQLMRLKRSIKKNNWFNKKSIVFHHDNTRSL